MSITFFFDELSMLVEDYITLSSSMRDTLKNMKNALLSFDNAKLNRILDEKLVLNEQIQIVNARLSQLISDRYGEFSKKTSSQLMDEFPGIKVRWSSLQSMMKSLKDHAVDIRRIVNAIDRYHSSMKLALESARPKLYQNTMRKGG